MSKKKSKKASKKSESDVGSTPTKSAIQTVYESFLNTESLTLSQQKNIVSALYLSNYSLYDSMIIEIITDFLQFAKSIQLNSNQIHSIYHTLQSLLHKIKNNADYSLDEATHYLNERISSQIEKEIENASDESEYISTQQSQSITEFIQQRIFSQYALYRVALFEQNPSNIRYKKFKKVLCVVHCVIKEISIHAHRALRLEILFDFKMKNVCSKSNNSDQMILH
eukprot:1085211_1